MPITIAHAKSCTIADGTNTDLVRPADWNSSHAVTFALSFSDIPKVDYFEPFILPSAASTLYAPTIGTWYFDPVYIPYGLNSGRIAALAANAAGFLCGAVISAASTGSVTKYQTLNNMIAFYQQGAGANSTRLESIWSADASLLCTQEMRVSSTATAALYVSNYLTVSVPYAWGISGNQSYSTFTGSGTYSLASSTAASTKPNSLITVPTQYVTGSRNDIWAFNTTLPAGMYWFAHAFSSASSTTGTNYGAGTLFSTQSRLGILEYPVQAYKQLGQSTTNSTSGNQAYDGYLATGTSLPTSALASSDMRVATSNAWVYWNYAQEVRS